MAAMAAQVLVEEETRTVWEAYDPFGTSSQESGPTAFVEVE